MKGEASDVGDMAAGDRGGAAGGGVQVARVEPRAGWQMPPKPFNVCPTCGGNVIARAYITEGFDYSEYWYLTWACDDERQLGCDAEFLGANDEELIEWPFDEGVGATQRDLQALGFEVTGDLP